jgi:hypothetical protein
MDQWFDNQRFGFLDMVVVKPKQCQMMYIYIYIDSFGELQYMVRISITILNIRSYLINKLSTVALIITKYVFLTCCIEASYYISPF